MRPRSLSSARWGDLILLLAFGLLYAATLDTGLQPYELHGGDLITHQYAQVQARPSNAPGYPLYTMGGWLWFHGWRSLIGLVSDLPNPMPILSSYSTIWALLALWLMLRIVRHLTRRAAQPDGNGPLALLITGFYGVTYFFWYYATTTEQYSSAIAHTLAILYLYLLWREDPSRRWRLYALAFLCGLSLAHMLTVALIVPGLVAVVLLQAPWMLRRPRIVIGAMIAAAAPLAAYSYVYIRGAAHPEWWGTGPWASPQEWFWSFVSTAQGRAELLWAFEPGRPFWGGGFPELIWQELSWPILVLGLIGVMGFDRRLRFLIYSTLALYVIFCWFYRFGNWFQVILPAYPLILLGLVPLVERIQGWAAQREPRMAQAALSTAPLILLAVALLWRGAASLPRADSGHRPEDTALQRAAQLVAAPIPPGAALFAPVDDALALTYLIEIWQIRPDLEMVSRAQAEDALASGRALLATWEAAPTLLAELPDSDALAVQGFGADWVELRSPPFTTPPAAITAGPSITPLDYPITPGLALVGYTATPAPSGAPVAGDIAPGWDVTLVWETATGGWPAGLSISVRLMHGGALLTDEDGQPVQQDRPRPVHGLWRDGVEPAPATIADGYHLASPLPANGLPADGLLVIVYTADADGFRNLAEFRLPLSTSK